LLICRQQQPSYDALKRATGVYRAQGLDCAYKGLALLYYVIGQFR